MTALACIVGLALIVPAVWAAPAVRATDPPSLAIEVAKGAGWRRLPVASPQVVHVRQEQVAIGEDAPNEWMAGTRLAALRNPWGSFAHDALVPGSVVVRLTPEGEPLRAGEDYLLDERWAGLGRTASGRIPKGATVYVDYAYYLSRLDTVQVTAAGTPSLRRGKPAVVCPHPAGAAREHQALANIWVRGGMTAVSEDDIYRIGPSPRFRKPDRSPTAGTRKLLAAGGQVTIVAFGDSVTVGWEASKPELAFPQLFASTLQARYPKADIRLVNAGIGGSNTDHGLERLDRDVLAHHPQLVIIEFVNDLGWRPEKVRQNYQKLIPRLRAGGAEVVIITPHFMCPEWMDRFDADVAVLREVAAQEKVGLADTAARWAALRQQGIPYMTLLVNGINHPDDRGHQMFVDTLMELF